MANQTVVAYVAEGKLYMQRPGNTPQLLESDFVQEILNRAEKQRERNNWKSDGIAWNLRPGGFSPLGNTARPAEVRQIRYDSLSRGHNPSEIFYSITSNFVGGIFHLELNGNYERRLLHRNGLCVPDLALHPSERKLAVSVRNDDQTSHIGILEVDRRGIREITEGDSVDESPSWIPGKPQELLYQSAGNARDPNGLVRVLGPYAVHRLDIENSSHQTILQDDKFDFLLPRQDAAGGLLFIRRPYQPYAPVPILKTIEDAVLFPFRSVRTIAHVLHVVSMAVTGKPMISAGGPRQQGPVPEQMMLWGRLVQANDAARRGPLRNSESLVPSDWQLISRDANGSERVIADRVVNYDLAPDGSVVYSTGRRVWQIAPGGEKQEVASGRMISKVAALV